MVIRQSQTVDGVTTNFLVDPNRSYHQVLEEQDDLFIPQVTYTYGDDLINQTNSQGTHTFGYDGLGSTRILTDVTGAVQNSYGYQAFGELDYQFGSIENNYLFTGEQYDNNVGFYYLRARYYNPAIGRFSQMDVFPGMQFEPKSLHKYLYANGSPTNFVDPSGYYASISQFSLTQAVSSIISTYASASFKQTFVKVGVSLLTAGVVYFGGQSVADLINKDPQFATRTLEDSRAKVKSNVESEARSKGITQVLFYYSSAQKIKEIFSTGLKPTSPKWSGLGTAPGTPRPPGSYGTLIPPWIESMTQAALSGTFYGGDQTRNVSWFLAFDGSLYRPVYGAPPTERYFPGPYPGYVPVISLALGPNLMLPK